MFIFFQTVEKIKCYFPVQPATAMPFNRENTRTIIKNFSVIFMLIVFIISCDSDTGDFPPDAALECIKEELAGIWLLENQNTWNEITCNESGSVISARHPHGVRSVSGQITLTGDCVVSGWYRIIDEESLENIPPQPKGTWTSMLDGYMKRGKSEMVLDYVLEYEQQDGPTETYSGTWYAEKRD